MRRLAWIAALLMVVLVAATVAVTLSLNRIIAANRQVILAELETLLGRTVEVSDITVRFRPYLGISLQEVEIGEDPGFGRDPFLRARELSGQVSILPLLQRRIEVTRIRLRSPTIRLVRDLDGSWNYESLGGGGRHSRNPPRSPVALYRVSSSPVPAATGESFSLVIASAALDDGTAVLIDRTQSVPTTHTARQVSLRLRDISRDDPIGFQLAAAFDSPQLNLDLAGVAGPFSEPGRLPITVQGHMGPFPGFNAVVDGLDLKLLFAKHEVEIERLSGSTLGGSFAVSGAVGLGGGRLRLVGEVLQVSVAELTALRGEQPARPVAGRGSLRFDLQGSGGASLMDSLSGTVAVEVFDGVIHDLNLVKELLDRVSGLPGLTRLVSERMEPKYGRLFRSNDTRFEKMKGTCRLAGGRADTDDLEVEAEDFAVRGRGWFRFDRKLDIVGTLLMSRRFSDDVVADVKQAKYVVDQDGRLAIPFRLRGVLGEARPKPDERQLGQMLERAVKRGAASELLDRVFGKKARDDPRSGEAEGPADALERELRDLLGR
jgi:uncharacterized protein involved in outer membrane biogenesis